MALKVNWKKNQDAVRVGTSQNRGGGGWGGGGGGHIGKGLNSPNNIFLS